MASAPVDQLSLGERPAKISPSGLEHTARIGGPHDDGQADPAAMNRARRTRP
jgi:hypothetical protein